MINDRIDLGILKYPENYSSNTTFTFGSNLPPTSFVFKDDKYQSVGRLFWNNGKLDFEGDTTESAKYFVDYLLKLFNEQIKSLKEE